MGGNSGSRFHRWLEAGIDLQMAHRITLPGAAAVAGSVTGCWRKQGTRPWRRDRGRCRPGQEGPGTSGAQLGPLHTAVYYHQADLDPSM